MKHFLFILLSLMLLAGCQRDHSAAEYTVTVSDNGKGTATADKTTAAEGDTVTLTATANEGCEFIRWTAEEGDVKFSDTASAQATFTMPTGNVSVKAVFEGSVYTITVSDDGNGTAQADKASAPMGETVTLTATANVGCAFVRWTVEEGDVTLSDPASANATFTMPASGVSVRAEFRGLAVPDGSALEGITGGGEVPTGTNTYVGAFWRANQKGERVIKINVGTDAANLGDWSAELAWYGPGWDPAKGDGVVLAVGNSPDPDIYKAVPGNAEDYPVEGIEASVSGTAAVYEDIVFRIGLTKAFEAYDEAANPARYAVVVLTYGTPAKKQLLFLRQGEGADYIMRPGDKDGSGGSDNRSHARKFSPYNLTDPTGNECNDIRDMTSPETGLLPVRGGIFVDYPTKAGYFFQYNSSTRAYHPTLTWNVDMFAWNLMDLGPEFWNEATDETCPAGYRRPHDGDTSSSHNSDGPVAGSEMRQSLWLNPEAGLDGGNADNSLWGYYADGWFDRLRIVDAGGKGGVANTAVFPETKDAAYIGRLFFNPATVSAGYNSSLFFPSAGLRILFDGSFYNAGYCGMYWTSSSYVDIQAWYLIVSGGDAIQQWSSRAYGASVRCVRQ